MIVVLKNKWRIILDNWEKTQCNSETRKLKLLDKYYYTENQL